uniref:Uncharacterized protein n=1 Tax=Setaria italica TaxID=4555 RepID=K3YP18_SETIT
MHETNPMQAHANLVEHINLHKQATLVLLPHCRTLL